MIGNPLSFGVTMSRSRSASSTRWERCHMAKRAMSPRTRLTSRPAIVVASDATGDGPE